MSLNSDYADRIRRATNTLARLDVDRRDPERYHEVKDEAVNDLRKIADAVEIDQVFVGRQGLAAEPSAFSTGPRHVIDRKGRPVAVEIRRRMPRAVRGT